MDTDELSEPGGVIIPHGLGVTPSFKHRVGLNDIYNENSLSLVLKFFSKSLYKTTYKIKKINNIKVHIIKINI